MNDVGPARHGSDSVASGVFVLAGALLLLGGVFQALAGISAILNDQVFVVGTKYVWQLDLTAWGWIHLVIGAVLILAGLYVLRGATWAVWLAIVVAGLSAIANFMWLPYQPIWALVVIALDVLIIWALATRRGSIHVIGK